MPPTLEFEISFLEDRRRSEEDEGETRSRGWRDKYAPAARLYRAAPPTIPHMRNATDRRVTTFYVTLISVAAFGIPS